MNTPIATNDIPQNHTCDDLLREGVLKPESVRVRFTRSITGIWDVEVSILDAPWTFTSDVAEAIQKRTGLRATEDSRQRIIVCANGKTFRAPRGFVRVENLPSNHS